MWHHAALAGAWTVVVVVAAHIIYFASSVLLPSGYEIPPIVGVPVGFVLGVTWLAVGAVVRGSRFVVFDALPIAWPALAAIGLMTLTAWMRRA